jgi:hypothetical protein
MTREPAVLELELLELEIVCATKPSHRRDNVFLFLEQHWHLLPASHLKPTDAPD